MNWNHLYIKCSQQGLPIYISLQHFCQFCSITQNTVTSSPLSVRFTDFSSFLFYFSIIYLSYPAHFRLLIHDILDLTILFYLIGAQFFDNLGSLSSKILLIWPYHITCLFLLLQVSCLFLPVISLFLEKDFITNLYKKGIPKCAVVKQ